MLPEDILNFWFEEISPSAWWEKDESFDALLAERFGKLHQAARQGELADWRVNVDGRLAEILVLDQFSRNIFRDKPEAFASDSMALVLAQEAVNQGLASQLSPIKRAFLYLPYMHSESAKIHEHAVKLFSDPGLEKNYDFELKHKVIIDRFGRYPHRNKVLGRESTPEELHFLTQPNSSF